MPSPLLIRAGLLTPLTHRRWQYIEDGGLLIDQGRIIDIDRIERFTNDRDKNLLELNGLILPGFVDVHIHWVQHHVRGHLQADVMAWLREYIWPEESKFRDNHFAARHAKTFFNDTLRSGTTLGMAYSSPHINALHTAIQYARGDWTLGNTIMEKSAPEPLCHAVPDNMKSVSSLLAELGTRQYAITPRFALNCSTELMSQLGQLARRTGAIVQTHLSESKLEIEEVRKAFPKARDYTDVYDRAGLLTPRTVLGHCIHLSEREYRTLRHRGCWIAHCPSSNEALDSGRMDLESVRRHQLPFALASDVGAGPSHSMLHVMQRFLDQHRGAGISVSPQEALFRATLAGAQCLGRGREAGSLTPGKRADLVLLPRPASGTRIEDGFEELLLGDAATLEQRPMQTWLGGTQASPIPSPQNS